MKRKILPVIACCILFLLPSAKTFAQLSVGLSVGPATRWSVPKSIQSLGVGINASLRYKVWKGLVTGVNFSGYKFGPEEKNTGNVGYKISYYSYTGTFEYHLLKKKFKPYVGVDIGVFNYHTVTTINFGVLGDQSLVKNEYYFGFAPLLGANYSLTERFQLNANLKFNTVIIKEAAPIGYASLSLGFFYRLSR